MFVISFGVLFVRRNDRSGVWPRDGLLIYLFFSCVACVRACVMATRNKRLSLYLARVSTGTPRTGDTGQTDRMDVLVPIMVLCVVLFTEKEHEQAGNGADGGGKKRRRKMPRQDTEIHLISEKGERGRGGRGSRWDKVWEIEKAHVYQSHTHNEENSR